MTTRFLVVPLVLLLFFSVSIAQLWYLQIVSGDDLKEQAKMTGLIVDQTMAPRGRIYDREMNILANVRPSIVVTAKPAIAMQKPEVLDRLATILGTTRAKLEYQMRQQWHKSNFPVPVFVGATIQQAALIAESGEEFPGIGVQSLPMRETVGTAALEHILGNVWVPTEAIEQELKDSGQEFIPPYVGRDGVEREYEQLIMGVPGSTTYTLDRKRRPLRAVMSSSPVPGESLVLSLDLATQQVAKEQLAGHKGAVVALDPKTGEVIAMVSSPGYDLSIYDGGLTQAESDSINQNPDRPLLKRAIAGLYPAGSTFKIVTTLAAYMAGKFNPREQVFCPGYLTVGNRRVKCENHPAASYDFRWAFTRSCNSYFGRLGQKVGVDGFTAVAKQIGIGVPTGIDLPGEKAGLMPDADFVQKTHGRPFSFGDANNVGIGQGDLLVTPLQMACIAALVANEGTNYRPHVVRAHFPRGDKSQMEVYPPEVLHTFKADSWFWATLKDAMRNVVVAGTGKAAQIPGIPVDGKTGSAENSTNRHTHAWFVGFAPADDPKIAFAVIVENAGHGGTIAAPIAKKVIETYLRPRDQKEKSKAPEISVKLIPDDEGP